MFRNHIRRFHNYESITNSLFDKTIPPVKLSYELINKQSIITNTSSSSPILILHGLFGSKLNNRTLGIKLNEQLQRDIYLLDLRNHGDSPHNINHDYQSLSSDVENFIVEQNLKDSIIIGHSMGAKTGMALSLRNPNLISMLINVDNAPVNLIPNGEFLKYIDILNKIEKLELTKLKDADNEFIKIESNPLIRSFILQNMKKNSNGVLKSRIPLNILKKSIISGEISSWKFPNGHNFFNKPTLFLRGLKSKYLVDDYIIDIAKFYTNFEIKDLDCGHFVLYEKPKESIELIVDFIKKHEDHY
ncbi:hypothetical protein WICMUC_004162 [Wickerhamomyces mucosus]|uniref:AB hydrolase-1 domain-containing protein n=1 Tax=Wickerhamomyces mucosus TaxID=1378264 RepID=A0A9P8TC14_9ASCO|nr:hypothetical protein WICMUC_004162 [Wickerhamomyces mucosus]